ncbi:protein trichome birefringence-like 25 [Wolffia australiana]
MVKKMELEWNPFSLHQRVSCAKFILCILLIGLSVRLLLFSSSVLCPFGERPAKPSSSSSSSPPTNASILTAPAEEGPPKEKCDLFIGEWVPHPAGPAYTNESCGMIEDHQNCLKNGRPDTGYLHWKWKPRDCDLPLFDAKKFLESLRNKWLAFIGDSISRNHIQSLLCLLSKAEEPVIVYHDEVWRSRRWRFPSHNFTLSVVWSPFLVKAEVFEDMNGASSKEIQLYLDVLHEEWTSQLRNFDFVVASGGQWFLKTAVFWENNTVVGCHYCPGKRLAELGFEYAYRKALRLALLHVASSGFEGTFFFRTSTPDHFENGLWSTGGTCPRTRPFQPGDELPLKDVETAMKRIEMEAFGLAAARARRTGVDLRLVDSTYMFLLRPDGHPGPYRAFQPFASGGENATVQNDCLHWCLPGPIDSWNDLLMELVTPRK